MSPAARPDPQNLCSSPIFFLQLLPRSIRDPPLYFVARFLETIINLISLQPLLLFTYSKQISKMSWEGERRQHKHHFLMKPDQKMLQKHPHNSVSSSFEKEKSPLYLPVTLRPIL